MVQRTGGIPVSIGTSEAVIVVTICIAGVRKQVVEEDKWNRVVKTVSDHDNQVLSPNPRI